MHDSKSASTINRGASVQAKSGDNSTKPASNLKEDKEEPVPSFLKALSFYQTDIFDDF
jgi:hypothetical protein